MGKHVYLNQRTDSVMAVVMKMEELMDYIFRITANEKQFPRAYRYTLSNDLRDACLKSYKAIYKASFINPRTEKDYEKIFDYQEQATEYLLDIKALIVSSTKITKLRNPEYLAKLYEDVLHGYRHWRKNIRRNYSRLQKKLKMTPEERVAAKLEARESWLHYKASSLKHDADGFVVLHKREKKTKEERRNE